MSEDYAELMTTFPLLQGFTANGTRRLLAAGEITQLAAGEVLLKEGETAEFAVLILHGKIEVFVAGNHPGRAGAVVRYPAFSVGARHRRFDRIKVERRVPPYFAAARSFVGPANLS